MSNQEIKCRVSTCAHNDGKEYCSLDGIQVWSTDTEAMSKHQTECASFVAR